MGLLYPVTGVKFVFASSVFLAMMGWFSVLQRLQKQDIHCPQQQLQDWKSQAIQLQQQPQQLDNIIHMPHHAEAETRQLATINTVSTTPATTITISNTPPKRRLRVLMGIFTMDKQALMPYRRQFRKLFNIFHQLNDTRVCSLYDFQLAPNEEVRYQCEFIYTFVVGGVKEEGFRTELVDNSAPITISPPQAHPFSKDLRDNTDVTYLNIQENMNDGKSQTWFKYATTVMEQYDLDYVGKMDSDSLPYMDKFFSWARVYLPPPPYNSGILAGVPIDKMWWNKNKAEINRDVNEDFFKASYGKVLHLYAAGQCYIMSRDLAETVVLEAPKSVAYREGHEDHDIGAMAFHSTKPISFHFLSLQQQFWRHPVKRYVKKVRQWRTLWHNENLRLKKVLELRQQKQKQQASTANPNNPAVEDDTDATPEQLAAPVQLTLDEEEDGTEEEEADVDENGGGDGEGSEEETA